MISVLCTGGCGYVGYYVCKQLLSRKCYRVISADNLSNSIKGAVEELRRDPLFTNYEGDCGNKEFIEKVFSENKIDTVIHLAALKSVEESVENPVLYMSNISITITLLETMQRHNCKKLVFSSSACVYSENQLSPISEDGLIKPSNPYGIGKNIVEQLLSTMGPKWNIVCLRYFNPIGGRSDNSTSRNIIPSIARAFSEGKTFTINGFNYETRDGTCVRDYVSVFDVANAHAICIEHLHNLTYEAINIGSGAGVTVMELVQSYIDIHKANIDITMGPRREGDIPMYYANISKAKKILNWEPSMSLHEAIATITTD